MTELMIDFETMGQTPRAVVVSIGACFFDLETGTIGNHFYAVFDMKAQEADGREISQDTLKWWYKQSAEAKQVFKEKGLPPKEVLSDFSTWVLAQAPKGKVKPWGNGSSFDISIIEDLFRQYEVECPWIFWNVMDVRTFKRFMGGGEKIAKGGTNHNALDDSISQANYIIEHVKIGK